MGRIVNNPQNKKKDLPANFYRDICYGEYVLVLGEDVILKKEYGNGSAKKYINKKFDGWLEEDQDRIDDIENSSNSAITRRNYLREFLSTRSYDVNKISDSLVRLLKTRFFPLVLTTGFDGYVEELMKKIYGKDLVVMNFFENKGDLRKNNEFDTLSPTLYYVFGKAQASDDLTFAYKDDDYIDALCKWMGSDRPQGLIEYIKEKKILVIGGNNKDWYFRFFWRSLRKSLLERKDDVAISLNDEKSDLLRFLKRNNITNHTETAREFIEKLSDKLCNPDDALLKDIHEGRYRQFGGLFISYAHEDYPIVCRIHAFLVSLNIKVWFDNKNLIGGDDYDERIHDAISQCKIFMPILSSNTKGDWKTESRKNANEKRYFIKEWEEVLNNKNAKIIPVVLNGFNIKKDKSIFPPERFDRTIVDWAKEGESGIEKALRDKINDIYCS